LLHENYTIKEGNFSTNKTKDFTLLTEENKDTVKGIRMSVTPFLIITEKDTILLDAGIGWKNEEGKTVISEILERKMFILIRLPKFCFLIFTKTILKPQLPELKTDLTYFSEC
jgi:hypothetical protein